MVARISNFFVALLFTYLSVCYNYFDSLTKFIFKSVCG